MTLTMFMVILFCLVITALGFWYASGAIARPNNNTELEKLIDQVLPQTQCGLCNFKGCLPYARAITAGQADINQCPPGGSSAIRHIAELTGREFKPLRSDLAITDPDQVALIDEDTCIGCVKCIRACPVDAIIGAAKQMHTVIPDSCTGCSLCIDPCPVDCISIIPINRDHHFWKWVKPGKAVPV